jgi:hypothetical protein
MCRPVVVAYTNAINSRTPFHLSSPFIQKPFPQISCTFGDAFQTMIENELLRLLSELTGACTSARPTGEFSTYIPFPLPSVLDSSPH